MLKLILLSIALLFSAPIYANENVIKMGYKSIAKPPLIGGINDNSGLYLDLFKTAAERIGYELEVIRIPKKRLHAELSKGTVDFYPGSSFSEERASYLYYLPNGLQTKEVLVSLNKSREIEDFRHVSGRLMVELSSSKLEWDQLYPNITVVKISELSMDKVVKALKSGRGDFYIADIEIVDHYKKTNNLSSYEEIGLKIHHNAIDKTFKPMNMGFSRFSKLFAEQLNPDFATDKKVSIENFYTTVDKQSVAYQFYLTLEQLKKDGITQQLYDHHFK